MSDAISRKWIRAEVGKLHVYGLLEVSAVSIDDVFDRLDKAPDAQPGLYEKGGIFGGLAESEAKRRAPEVGAGVDSTKATMALTKAMQNEESFELLQGRLLRRTVQLSRRLDKLEGK